MVSAKYPSLPQSVTSELQSISKIFRKRVRLQALSQATKWRQHQEGPKVAVWGNRPIATVQALLHLPALVVGLLLILFNIRGYLFGNVSSTTLSALQFPAKLLEMLMQLSLSAILLTLVRNAIVGDD